MSDDWDFYRLRVDNRPASIMVDLGIRNSIPLTTHKFMGYLRTQMNNPRSDGLSSQDEFDKLCEIGDSVKNAVAENDQFNIYVGRNTSDGNRDFFFYTSDLEHLHLCLKKVVQAFPSYQFTLGGRKDAEWSTYQNFLYPSPSQEQQIMDRRVCNQLEANGDDLSIERKIDHRVYFSNKSKLKLYENYLIQNDFIEINIGKTKPLFGKSFIDFKHIGAPKEISDVVYVLFDKAQELGGDYDGWGCSVQQTSHIWSTTLTGSGMPVHS